LGSIIYSYVAPVAGVLDKMPGFKPMERQQLAEEKREERVLVSKERLERRLRDSGFSEDEIRRVMVTLEEEAGQELECDQT